MSEFKLLGVSAERNKHIQSLIQQLRAEMVDLNDYQRVEIVDEVRYEYCRDCGRVLSVTEYCHCTNDE